MKLLFKYILLYLGGTVFFACQTQHSIEGKYTIVQRGKYPKSIPVTLNVTLNSDSTFAYNSRFGFHGETSSGNWSTNQKRNNVFLRSYIQNMHDIPLIVAETKNDKCVSSVFVFNNPLKSDTLTQWMLNINGIDYPMNEDTFALNNDFIVEHFCIRGFHSIKDSTWIIPIPSQDTIQSKTYYVKNRYNNVYHIAFQPFVNCSLFHYKPIQDVFILKNNTLLFNGIKLRKKE